MSARFTSLNRYSNWDGSQNAALNADDLLSALSEDLMEFGDLQQAMRYLMQRGMETSDGNYIKGLRDLVHQLKAEKQQRLERFDINGVMEDIKRQLEEILGMERDTINEWANRKKDPEDENQENFSNSVLGDIGEQNKEFIKNLPDDAAGKVKALQDYEFLNTDAQKQFLKLTEQLRKAMTQSFFRDVENMVNEMSDGDINRMKNMVKDLNDMLVRKIAGEDPGFGEFMAQVIKSS